MGTQGVGKRRHCRRHRRRRKRTVATTQVDTSAPGATRRDEAVTSLQVPRECVRAVVRCQQMFRISLERYEDMLLLLEQRAEWERVDSRDRKKLALKVRVRKKELKKFKSIS